MDILCSNESGLSNIWKLITLKDHELWVKNTYVMVICGSSSAASKINDEYEEILTGNGLNKAISIKLASVEGQGSVLKQTNIVIGDRFSIMRRKEELNIDQVCNVVLVEADKFREF